MKSKVISLMGEAKNKMNGYLALTSLRYGNLCVKAEMLSLLPVTVVIDDEEMNIEAVADVGTVDDKTIGVIPKQSAYLYEIGKGVMEAHPEFKMDIKQNENSDDEEDKYLTFAMPDVDKDRHKLLSDGVDGLNDQCKAKIDAIYDYYTAQIALHMVNADAETVDKVKDELKKVYDFHNDTLKKMTEDKKKEIDDAYAEYQQKQAEKEQQKGEKEAAENPLASVSMQMPGQE